MKHVLPQRLRRAALVALAVVASTCAFAQPAVSDAQLGMKLFMVACVPSGEQAGFIEKAAAKLGLEELQGADASRFLAGTRGRTWATGGAGGQFALAATDPDTCTVTIGRADRDQLEREFQSWLPPASTGLVATQVEGARSEGSRRTLSYLIRREGRLVASWALITTGAGAGSSVQGTVSVRAATN